MKLKVTTKTKSIISPEMSDSDKLAAVLNMHLVTYLRGPQYGENWYMANLPYAGMTNNLDSRLYLQLIGKDLHRDWYGDFKPQNPGRFLYEDLL